MLFQSVAPRALPLAAAFLLAPLSPASSAVGDLLVAPTRVVLNGARGTELILNNIGNDTATYRVSLELRHMTSEGNLEPVANPTPAEEAALALISYAPRRVTLAPNQPQSIRISIRPPAGLPDGEYRAHLVFRATHESASVAARPAATSGVSVALTPIYGVSIPVIARFGNLDAAAKISNPRLVRDGGKQAISFDLGRTGNRSVYGEVRVLKAGIAKPVVLARGIAVYTDTATRNVTLDALPDVTGSIAGPVTIQYRELAEDGGGMLAEVQTVLK